MADDPWSLPRTWFLDCLPTFLTRNHPQLPSAQALIWPPFPVRGPSPGVCTVAGPSVGRDRACAASSASTMPQHHACCAASFNVKKDLNS